MLGPPGNRGRQGSKYLQMGNLCFYGIYYHQTLSDLPGNVCQSETDALNVKLSQTR